MLCVHRARQRRERLVLRPRRQTQSRQQPAPNDARPGTSFARARHREAPIAHSSDLLPPRTPLAHAAFSRCPHHFDAVDQLPSGRDGTAQSGLRFLHRAREIISDWNADTRLERAISLAVACSQRYARAGCSRCGEIYCSHCSHDGTQCWAVGLARSPWRLFNTSLPLIGAQV